MRRALLLVGLLLGAAPASATMRYGAAVGPTTPLGPSDGLGVAVGLSASRADEAIRGELGGLLRVRGELLGLLGETGKAILPTLAGDLGLSVGAVDLFLTGGVQIFGVASRQAHTVFATFGLTGGAGLSTAVARQLRFNVRGSVTWLPGFSAARLSGPEEGLPTFAWLAVLVGLEYRPAGRLIEGAGF